MLCWVVMICDPSVQTKGSHEIIYRYHSYSLNAAPSLQVFYFEFYRNSIPKRDSSEKTDRRSQSKEARAATMAAAVALRCDWKFYAVVSFCHTFRAVMRLPAFSADQLERGLVDPLNEVVVIELVMRLIEKGGRSVKLAVNDWERRLKTAVNQIAQESDYWEDKYPDPEWDSEAENEVGEETISGDAGTDEKDPQSVVPGDEDDDFDPETHETVTREDSQHDSEEETEKPRGHPLRGGCTFFTLTCVERLDVVNALCEQCLESDEACVDEIAAMAAAHASVSGDAYHPEAHGEAIGSDALNRVYFVSGSDVRLWRWEKPVGTGGRNKNSSQKDPQFATVCASIGECRLFAASLGNSKSPKDRALRLYLTQTHMPQHERVEEKAEKAARIAAARQEDLERRTRNKEAYDRMDRKRSGRIAMKIVEDAERRRVREEGEEAEAEAEAEAERREVEVWKRQIKWMMLPARFREADTPEGMDPATSHAAVEAERARLAALASETEEARLTRETSENPPGDETVGRYLRIHWGDDGAWYDAVVEAYCGKTNTHTVRYLADSTCEKLDLKRELKKWADRSEYVTSAGASIPPPEREPNGLEYRGVKSETGNLLFVWRPKQVAEDPVVAATTTTPVPDANETDERKKHSCRVCLEHDVVSVDHGKFGKRCPFHPEFVGVAASVMEQGVYPSAVPMETTEQTVEPVGNLATENTETEPMRPVRDPTATLPKVLTSDTVPTVPDPSSTTAHMFQTAAVGVPRESNGAYL